MSKTETRAFHPALALAMTGLVLAGFWPSYFGVLVTGAEYGRHWVFHVHAIVFMGWMAALIVQVTLAARRDVRTHMAVGRWGFVLGVVVFAMGLIVTAVLVRDLRAAGAVDSWPASLWYASAPLMDIIQFGILLALGWTHRRRIEYHRRYMVLATVAILPAATARMAYLLGPWSFEMLFLGLVAILIARDLRLDGRVHRANLIGFVVLLPRLLLNVSFKFVGG